MKFLLTNVLTLCIGIAVGNGLAYLSREPSLKEGDCVRKLGSNLKGIVHIIQGDTVELYYELSNNQIIFDVATRDGIQKVSCE